MERKKEMVLTGPQMKVILSDPKVRAELTQVEIKRRDKLNAMKIAQTHIEIQNLDVEPKGAIKIADEFLVWLKK